MGWVCHAQPRQLEDQSIPFLCGLSPLTCLVGETQQQLHYRHQGHLTTQAATLRQSRDTQAVIKSFEISPSSSFMSRPTFQIYGYKP
jgi:hypothetical protein